MKYALLLAAVLSLGSVISSSAIAGEGATTLTARRYASRTPTDVGSAQFPDVSGRPGTALTSLDNTVLPSNGSNGPVQSANSLPRGFENGTVAYTQAQSVQSWMLAHNGGSNVRVAAR